MKYIVVLGDGMADEPIEALGNRTPLQAANIPYIDQLAKEGKSGVFKSVPDGFHPGSEIANLTVLGYDVAEVFEGRGSLEAAAMGIELQPGDLALRCNLICIENENIKNHSAGHISDDEAEVLVNYLNETICPDNVTIYSGVSYRHLMVIKGGNKAMKCTAPHDVMDQPYKSHLVKSLSDEAKSTTDLVNELIEKSLEVLPSHPVNLKRIAEGKDPASSIWPWSPGYKPAMKTMMEEYGLGSGAVISAVDLIRGIGVYAGLEVIKVEGATGLYDTNYEGKAQATIDAIKKHDFVYLHIEASDEAGHEGDFELKTKTIEYLDQRAVKPIIEAVAKMDEPVAIAVLPDHPTPCRLKTHTHASVPFIIWYPGIEADSVEVYDEFESAKGAFGELQPLEFMNQFLSSK